jgi:hypothetical protein
LEITIPIPRPPCPIINSPKLTVKTAYNDVQNCLTPSKFTITPNHKTGNCNETGQCEFNVELEINVPIPRTPCPVINQPKIEVNAKLDRGGSCVNSSKFEITPNHKKGDCNKPDQCEFNVELEVNVPIPVTPCPVLNSRSISVTTKYDICSSGNGSSLTITPNNTTGDCDNPDQCQFDFDLQVEVLIPKPPCPNINVNTFDVTTGFSNSPCMEGKENKFEITTNHDAGDCTTPGQCNFDIDFEIVVPIPAPPCIEINAKSFTVKAGYIGSTCAAQPSKFEIHKNTTPASGCDVPEQCDFDITLDIVVPIPAPPCPTVTKFLTVNSHYRDAPGGRISNTPSFFNLTTTKTPPKDRN